MITQPVTVKGLLWLACKTVTLFPRRDMTANCLSESEKEYSGEKDHSHLFVDVFETFLQ